MYIIIKCPFHESVHMRERVCVRERERERERGRERVTYVGED